MGGGREEVGQTLLLHHPADEVQQLESPGAGLLGDEARHEPVAYLLTAAEGESRLERGLVRRFAPRGEPAMDLERLPEPLSKQRLERDDLSAKRAQRSVGDGFR